MSENEIEMPSEATPQEVIPEITQMRLSKCGNCGQRSELHQDPEDHKWYCEDCEHSSEEIKAEKKARYTGKSREELRGSMPVPEIPLRSQFPSPTLAARNFIPPPAPSSESKELLDFIVQNAGNSWIHDFCEKIHRRMTEDYGWIDEVQRIQDPMILLRMATELGWGKPDLEIIHSGFTGNTIKSPGPQDFIKQEESLDPPKDARPEQVEQPIKMPTRKPDGRDKPKPNHTETTKS